MSANEPPDGRDGAGLTGAGAEPPAGADLDVESIALRRLLDAAGGPAAGIELAREPAVLAAFAAAGARLRAQGKPAASRHAGVRRLSTGLVIGGIVGAAAIAGVGAAAASGGLPAPLQRAAHRVFDAPAPASPTRPVASVTPSGGAPSGSGTPTAGVSVTPPGQSSGSAPGGSSSTLASPSGAPSGPATSTGAAALTPTSTEPVSSEDRTASSSPIATTSKQTPERAPEQAPKPPTKPPTQPPTKPSAKQPARPDTAPQAPKPALHQHPASPQSGRAASSPGSSANVAATVQLLPGYALS
jgi:hypothetical protein